MMKGKDMTGKDLIEIIENYNLQDLEIDCDVVPIIRFNHTSMVNSYNKEDVKAGLIRFPHYVDLWLNTRKCDLELEDY